MIGANVKPWLTIICIDDKHQSQHVSLDITASCTEHKLGRGEAGRSESVHNSESAPDMSTSDWFRVHNE